MEMVVILGISILAGCLSWVISRLAFCVFWGGATAVVFTAAFSLNISPDLKIAAIVAGFWMLVTLSLQVAELYEKGDLFSSPASES